MESIIQDQKQMIKYLHKQAEEHVKTREMLIQSNEELEKEIDHKIEETKILKKELELKGEKEEENIKLKKSLKICEEVVDNMKLKEIESCRKLKDIQDDLNYSNLINKIDKENLEKDLLVKSEECKALGKRTDQLTMDVNDQKEEIIVLKKKLERTDFVRTSSSCGSIADEIDSANMKLENDALKDEMKKMKVQAKENKKERLAQLEKLDKLSAKRLEVMNRLKERI